MPLVCECFLLGWILTSFTKYKKTGKCFSFLALFLFLLFGYGFGRAYLYNLERRYPPFDPTPEQCEALRGAPVVVLGQGMPLKSDLPLRYQNNPVFERRLFEGVRMAKLIPESRLIVSMAGEASNSVKQAFLDGYMPQVNFPTNRVTMFTAARDTSEEAKLAKHCLIGSSTPMSNSCVLAKSESTNQSVNLSVSLERSLITNRAITQSGNKARWSVSGNHSTTVESEAVILIIATTASHMPRSIKIFQKQGLNPIASPSDYTELVPFKINLQWPYLPFPSGSGFETSQRALYEWLGNLYERTF